MGTVWPSMKQNSPSIKPSEAVASFYEDHGASFASTRHAAWDVLRRVQQAVVPGDVVVDIGAGNARLATILPEDVRYVAIEPSSALRVASKKNISRRGTEIRAGGFPSLPARDGESAVTACIAVLHHLAPDERAPAFRELARITKPGGTLILTVWNLRGLRMFGLQTWLAAWFRLPLVRGGGFGDVWVPWKAEGASAKRYVHAWTLHGLKKMCDSDLWDVRECVPWGSNGPSSIFAGRNLLIVAKRK